MDKNAVWALFEKTGSIGVYTLYRNIGATDMPDDREAANYANKNRRTDYTGSECR